MKINRLNRFTTLDILLDYLTRKKLVLLNPQKWEDKNDTEVILAYKKKAGIKNLLALCFTHDYETIHHWKTFASGSSGCCMEFDATRLLEILNKDKSLRHGVVEYKTVNEVESAATPVASMPFVKRRPYECEREYRVIWEGADPRMTYELDVPLETIRRITISQNMPEPVFKTIRDHLRSAFPDPEQKISRSTIYENKRWIKSFK